MSASKWLPPALATNPVWVAFARRVEKVWFDEITAPTLELRDLNRLDVTRLGREDLLKYARSIGWTFKDPFTADWGNNPKVEQFVRQFIYSWAEFCRSKGDSNFIDYVSYLLQLPVKMHVMWTNVREVPYDGSLGDNFLLGGTPIVGYDPQLETYPEISYGTLVRFENLDVVAPGWQTIVDDPDYGWYPTSHVELEYNATDVPASNMEGMPPTSIIYDMFSVIAPLQLVLKSVITKYETQASVNIKTGELTRLKFV